MFLGTGDHHIVPCFVAPLQRMPGMVLGTNLRQSALRIVRFLALHSILGHLFLSIAVRAMSLLLTAAMTGPPVVPCASCQQTPRLVGTIDIIAFFDVNVSLLENT